MSNRGANDLAAQLKERLNVRDVVEFYGFHPDRAGFIQCPFHAGDDHGSLKIYDGDKGWHCFGCGAGSSVIDFVMRLFDISFRQACVRLNVDFSLRLVPGRQPSKAGRSAVLEARRQEEEQKAGAAAEYRRMAAEHCYWWDVAKYFAPTPPDADAAYIHPLYAEALRRLPLLGYWLDENLGR